MNLLFFPFNRWFTPSNNTVSDVYAVFITYHTLYTVVV